MEYKKRLELHKFNLFVVKNLLFTVTLLVPACLVRGIFLLVALVGTMLTFWGRPVHPAMSKISFSFHGQDLSRLS